MYMGLCTSFFVGLWSDEMKLEIVITFAGFWDFPRSSPE